MRLWRAREAGLAICAVATAPVGSPLIEIGVGNKSEPSNSTEAGAYTRTFPKTSTGIAGN